MTFRLQNCIIAILIDLTMLTALANQWKCQFCIQSWGVMWHGTSSKHAKHISVPYRNVKGSNMLPLLRYFIRRHSKQSSVTFNHGRREVQDRRNTLTRWHIVLYFLNVIFVSYACMLKCFGILYKIRKIS
jgi:hypothetical protein